MGKLENIDVKVKSKALVNQDPEPENNITDIKTSDLYIDGPMKINDPKYSAELCVGNNCYKQKDFKTLLNKSAIPYQYFDGIDGGVIPSVGDEGLVDPVPNLMCLERHINKDDTNEKEDCKKPRKNWFNNTKKNCDICLKPWHLKMLKGDDLFHISDKTHKSVQWTGDTCKNNPSSPGCEYKHIRDYPVGLHRGHHPAGEHNGKDNTYIQLYNFNNFFDNTLEKGKESEKKSRFKFVSDNTSFTGKYCKTI